jgi:hypothetical protein
MNCTNCGAAVEQPTGLCSTCGQTISSEAGPPPDLDLTVKLALPTLEPYRQVDNATAQLAGMPADVTVVVPAEPVPALAFAPPTSPFLGHGAPPSAAVPEATTVTYGPLPSPAPGHGPHLAAATGYPPGYGMPVSPAVGYGPAGYGQTGGYGPAGYGHAGYGHAGYGPPVGYGPAVAPVYAHPGAPAGYGPMTGAHQAAAGPVAVHEMPAPQAMPPPASPAATAGRSEPFGPMAFWLSIAGTVVGCALTVITMLIMR